MIYMKCYIKILAIVNEYNLYTLIAFQCLSYYIEN